MFILFLMKIFNGNQQNIQKKSIENMQPQVNRCEILIYESCGNLGSYSLYLKYETIQEAL